MHNEITYSFLTWENPHNLPIPQEVKHLTDDILWDSFSWEVMGLPENGAEYSLQNGTVLYREASPDGSVALKKEEFTGTIIVATYLVDQKGGDRNFLLSFRAVLFKGEIKGVEVEKVIPDDKTSLNLITEKVNKEIEAENKRLKSFWFRFLYLPYKVILRFTGFGIGTILVVCKIVINKIILFLTPY